MNNSNNLEEELTHKFLEVLRGCSHPCNSFSSGSKELKLSEAWLQYLLHYHCHNNMDRRVRITYMFGLSKCIAQKRLRGPFTKLPPQGRLLLKYKGSKNVEPANGEVICFRCNQRNGGATLPGSSSLLKLFELPYCPCQECEAKIKGKSSAFNDVSKDMAAFDIPKIPTAHKHGKTKEKQRASKKPKVFKELLGVDSAEMENKNEVKLEDCDFSSSTGFRLKGGKDDHFEMPRNEETDGGECVLAAYLKKNCHDELDMPILPPVSRGNCVIEKTVNLSSENFNGFVSDMFLCNKVKYNCKNCNKSLTTVEMQYLENAKMAMRGRKPTESKPTEKPKIASTATKPEQVTNDTESDRISTSTFVIHKATEEPQKSAASSLLDMAPIIHQLTGAFASVCEKGALENLFSKESSGTDGTTGLHGATRPSSMTHVSAEEAWEKDIELAKGISCHDDWKEQKQIVLEQQESKEQMPAAVVAPAPSKRSAEIPARIATRPATEEKHAHASTGMQTEPIVNNFQKPKRNLILPGLSQPVKYDCPYCVRYGIKNENKCQLLNDGNAGLKCKTNGIFSETVTRPDASYGHNIYTQPFMCKDPNQCAGMYANQSCYANLILQRCEQATPAYAPANKGLDPLLYEPPNITTTAYKNDYGTGIAFSYQNHMQTMTSSTTTTTTTSTFEIGSGSDNPFFNENTSLPLCKNCISSVFQNKSYDNSTNMELSLCETCSKYSCNFDK